MKSLGVEIRSTATERPTHTGRSRQPPTTVDPVPYLHVLDSKHLEQCNRDHRFELGHGSRTGRSVRIVLEDNQVQTPLSR